MNHPKTFPPKGEKKHGAKPEAEEEEKRRNLVNGQTIIQSCIVPRIS